MEHNAINILYLSSHVSFVGEHTFTVRSIKPSTNPFIPRMLCSINLHEFGNENEFHIDNDVVSAYQTWDVNRRVTYRPTNAGITETTIFELNYFQ